MTAATGVSGVAPIRRKRPVRRRRRVLHAFLITMSILWLWPLVFTIYTALRPVGDTIANGYVSFTGLLNIDNFVNAWNEADLPYYYLNTAVVAVPGVILTLFLASMIAFAVSRFSWRFNLSLLMLFTAGNLLPPQIIIVPLYFLYLAIHIPPPFSDNGLLYNQYVGIILIHVVFQTGFCAFVLSNYMRTISKELTEAALVDGAGVWTIYRRVIMPICRPALAALAVLEFTFIYNDFFWAVMLIKDGSRRPITGALQNLQGTFFTNENLVAAGALLAAIPTIIVFVLLQRQFVRGLTLGATKG